MMFGLSLIGSYIKGRLLYKTQSTGTCLQGLAKVVDGLKTWRQSIRTTVVLSPLVLFHFNGDINLTCYERGIGKMERLLT